MAEEVTYHLDEFDGPLDLLLHLIKVNEMDILDIPIVVITEQYLDFLHQAEERNLDIAGEFLVMAATLMSIKSTYLIPKNEELTYDQDLAEFVYEEDPREALMAQLLEYQRYQQAADDLREREEGRQLQFSRAPMAIPEDIEVAPLPEGLGLFDLQLAFNQMVANRTKKQVRPRTLRGDTWSIREQMSHMMADMTPGEKRTFASFFGEDDSRDKLVTTFLAMLELVRHQNLFVTQENEFGTIQLQLGDVPYDENEELDDEE
ncbi:segregation and condensation protein A [Weissella cibaria]|uniref:segregation and condensation protein A n=1 Tax=Weissella cibaria TaxID=137591 RepID=UPI0018A10FC5|nr:segregation/condensation protein A [Weissella cibaria]